MKTPKIIISEIDLERLERLLESLPANAFPGRAALEAELDRADIVPAAQMPANVVTMNSEVKFSVSSSNDTFCLRLVYPKDATGEGTISILAPVGSALLGLSQGDEIEWPGPGGSMVKVRIEEIVYQPERNGDFHR
ncbi:nucleoside diphosphate kinase regulator [Shewanella xiamenensis]|uniref:nucleoside diphosphate kinase regulator n=1 Tax=Shewanella TaxID=22 RepID=UPI0002EBE7B5|nr:MULTISPECIES: nucleoside diphosphate kinase regulator [Shewanella]ASF14705.1 nucleoside diphosphate kinase regulator [Shewanella sp. FDAARGOS_354]MCT8858567.1 nucleoside diphosphate kinase regulator [Shewanella xiamenensis]MDH1627024.1 nucleoside diphosphate kinase regulator [Shewanella xiamenensis]MDV5248979.1 nucleoside diphosphate kinase regulator [Shewanella xiamenensis]PWH01231.1 nucleoside diphosphate kinase regulator [Shewanella xiamenensis]